MSMDMPKSDVPTLEDVARAADVSTATVSRCLNSPDQVREPTRLRVQEAVRKLGYTPNFGARALAAKRTNTYGAIIPTMENAIFARGLEAFQQVLVDKGATMLVASSSYDPDIEEHQIRTMIARGAEGLLLIGTERNPDIHAFLKERNIPVVIAWARSDDASHSYVGFDNVAASKALIREAIALGHASFAYLSARTSMNDRARDRLEGARQAIAEAGFDPASMPVIETQYSIQCGREAFHKVLQKSASLPTLVICGNDVLAVGAVQAAREASLAVPDDISVVGFDDIELATVISPALTTVHVPHQDMGRVAAETLLSLTEDLSNPVRIDLETYVVKRASLGRPRERK